MRKIDIALGVVGTAFSLAGLVYVVPNWIVSLGYIGIGMSPSFFPNFTLTLTLGLSVILVVSSLAGRGKSEHVRIFNQGERVRFILSLALILGSLLWLYFLGFIITGVLCTAAAMVLLGARRPVSIALISLLAPLILWRVFSLLLNMTLPQGLLFS